MPDRPVIVDVEELVTLAMDSAGDPDLHPEEVLLLAVTAQRSRHLLRLATKLHRHVASGEILFLTDGEVAEYDRILMLEAEAAGGTFVTVPA